MSKSKENMNTQKAKKKGISGRPTQKEINRRRELIKEIAEEKNYILTNRELVKLTKEKMQSDAILSKIHSPVRIPVNRTLYNDIAELELQLINNSTQSIINNGKIVELYNHIHTYIRNIRVCVCGLDITLFPISLPRDNDNPAYSRIIPNYIQNNLKEKQQKEDTLYYFFIIFKEVGFEEFTCNYLEKLFDKSILYTTIHRKAAEIVFNREASTELLPILSELIPSIDFIDNTVTPEDDFISIMPSSSDYDTNF